MAIPRSKEARLFLPLCAFRGMRKRRSFSRRAKPTGAVYLAGYGMECMLKALVLSVVPQSAGRRRAQDVSRKSCHEYEWLRSCIVTRSGAAFPGGVNQCFALVDDWSTDMRYQPGKLRDREAESFMKTAGVILRVGRWEASEMAIDVNEGRADEVH